MVANVIQLPHQDSEAVEPFYIPASTSILERRPRILKHGNTFAMFDHYGDITGRSGAPEGLYHEDMRFLSLLMLKINGSRPLLLSSNVQNNNVVLGVDLTNPDYANGDQITLARDTVHLIRSKFLWNAGCHERLGIHNYDVHPHDITITLSFGCDFADLFEVRGQKREHRGEYKIEMVESGVICIYTGLDKVVRRTVIRFDPAPGKLDKQSATFQLSMDPGKRLALFYSIRCLEKAQVPPRHHFSRALREARSCQQDLTCRVAGIETSNAIFDEIVRRSASDLAMLTTATPQGDYPYAGIPWYSTVFGRDGIITAMQMLWADPQMALGVLNCLAHWQARETDLEADAEPGKIVHEMRFGEMARLKEVPFGRYYGSVDSTPLFVMLAGMYYERTGDTAAIARLWPNIEAALRWMDRYGDLDGDGFIEYPGKKNGGLTNQGWKDSHDSVFHADGALARGPIALCEVQGYAYAARLHAAKMAEALGLKALAAMLEHQAAALKVRFVESFWCEDIGTFALALDGDKHPCRVRTSNAGHLLFTGMIDYKYAEMVANQLLSEEFFTGWGIRTVAATEVRYNPMSYHNGSVWPHDNALIALGMANYGFIRRCQRVFTGVFDAATPMELRRLPELFCGFSRRPGRNPTLYPVACMPQAWASAVPFSLLKACLGLNCNPMQEEICFRRPSLPSFLDRIILRQIRAGESHMDIMLQRHGEEVAVNVLSRTGNGRVSVTL
ncbi:MAG: amylo-alpha-1,6-glucosidase [Pseudomonadota bacterium]|nr:amylo-alpha-1,6-glucosidase [Pseudomonadota bacterium]